MQFFNMEHNENKNGEFILQTIDNPLMSWARRRNKKLSALNQNFAISATYLDNFFLVN
jgi:hypothetical protein